MKRDVIDCDVKVCKNSSALRFYFFKDRKVDGAGGMENWNYIFDLCPSDLAKLFQESITLLEKLDKKALLKMLERVNLRSD